MALKLRYKIIIILYKILSIYKSFLATKPLIKVLFNGQLDFEN